MSVLSERLARVVVVCVLASSACSEPLELGFAVATTLHFDSTVEDASLSEVKGLSFDSDEPYQSWLTLDRPIARTERTVYRPLAKTRAITLRVQALAADGRIVASGAGVLPELTPGHTAKLEVLMVGGAALDLAAIDAAVDAAVPDLAEPDLVGVDLAGADFAGVDLATPVVTGCASTPTPYLCEDFEVALGPFWALPTAVGVTAAVDTTRPHSGTRSLHIHVPNTATLPNGNFLGGTIENGAPFVGFPATGDVYVSAHYYFASAIPAGSFFFLFQQWDTPFHWITVAGSGNRPRLSSDLSGQDRTSTIATVPIGQWTCLTLHVVRSASGQTRYLVDNVAATDVTNTGAFDPTPTYGRIRLGYQLSNPPATSAAANDIWIDDVRIDTSPIACAN